MSSNISSILSDSLRPLLGNSIKTIQRYQKRSGIILFKKTSLWASLLITVLSAMNVTSFRSVSPALTVPDDPACFAADALLPIFLTRGELPQTLQAALCLQRLRKEKELYSRKKFYRALSAQKEYGLTRSEA